MSVVTREMKIKNHNELPFHTIWKRIIITSEYSKKLGPSYIAGGTAMWENSLVLPQKVK